ncbi:HAD family hydrolase [soil metagenome]
MIKAILMDFNGVIIDDEPIQMKAYQEVLKGEGIDLTEEDYYASMGMDDKTFVENAFSRAEKTPEGNKVLEIIQAKTRKWHDVMAGDVPVFDGVENFIKKMEKDFALGIVSMAKREEIEYVLERTGLRSYFLTIISAEDVTNCKPDPEVFLKGFREIDAARTATGKNPIVHGECVVIEDSAAGVSGAKKAGMKTLGITNTVSEAVLREAGANAVSKNLDDWMPDSFHLVFN